MEKDKQVHDLMFKENTECAKLYHPSPRQLQDWEYHHSLKPNQVPEILSFSFRKSQVNLQSLKRALRILYERHESLRTFFIEKNDTLYQSILPYEYEIFGLKEYSARSLKQQDEVISIVLSKYLSKLKNINNSPLNYCILVKTHETDYRFFFLIHHIISDFKSIEILKQEINLLYRFFNTGIGVSLTDLPIQLKDFFNRKYFHRESDNSRTKNYWKEKLGSKELRKYPKKFLKTISPYFEKEINNRLIEILNSSSAKTFTYFTKCKATTKIDNLKKRYSFSFGAVINTVFFLVLRSREKQDYYLITNPISGRQSIKSKNIIGNLMGGIYYYVKNHSNSNTHKIIEKFQIEYFRSSRHIIYNHKVLDLDLTDLRLKCDLALNILNQQVDITNKPLPRIHLQLGSCNYFLECIVMKSDDELMLSWKYNSMIYASIEIEEMSMSIEKIIKNLMLKS